MGPRTDPPDPRRRRGLLSAGLLGVLLVAALGAEAAWGQPGTGTLRVDGVRGSDNPDCGGEESPCARIQQAVNLAESGDRILVATGTYTYDPALDIQCTSNVGKTGVVCILNKVLTLLGGFPGDDWSVRPDPEAFPTVVDGQDAFRGVLILRTSPTAPPASLVFEGFTVTAGFATADEDGETAFGGGLSATLADLEVRDVVFDGNRVRGADSGAGIGGSGAGGGLAIRGSQDGDLADVTLARIEFRNNLAEGGAGGSRGGLALGGGLFTTFVVLRGHRIQLSDNRATAGASDGAGMGDGLLADALGGAAAFSDGSDITLDEVSATSNTAQGGDAGSGAGDAAGGAFGGGFFGERATLTINGGSATGNSAVGGDADEGGIGAGGGIKTTRTTLTLERVALIDNLAQGGTGSAGGRKGSGGGGGGHFTRPDDDPAFPSTLTLRHTIVAGNRAALGTGGGAVGGGGGGLFVKGSEITLHHATLARNEISSTAMQGRAIVLVDSDTGGPDTVADIEHSIVAEHFAPPSDEVAIHVQEASSANFLGGLFADNEGGDTNAGLPNAGTFTGLDGVIQAESAGFVAPAPPDRDFHLDAGSEAVDAAPDSPATIDFDGASRDLDPDVGADEEGAVAHTLAIRRRGLGSGIVTSDPAGISCGEQCVAPFDDGTHVGLEATADADSVFAGWAGEVDCGDAMVTLTADTECEAIFDIFVPQFTLSVAKSGSGSGTVTSDPAGIDCGSDCEESYDEGTTVALTAVPDPGFDFNRWQGDADCVDGEVGMDADRACEAVFAECPPDELSVAMAQLAAEVLFEACVAVHLGPEVEVTADGVVSVAAGDRVTLDGAATAVAVGGELAVRIVPCGCP